MNVQTPVRQCLEAVVTTANELLAQLAASRGETKRLEARLEGMEEMVRKELEVTQRVCLIAGVPVVVFVSVSAILPPTSLERICKSLEPT